MDRFVACRRMVTVLVQKPDNIGQEEFEETMGVLYDQVFEELDVRKEVASNLTDPGQVLHGYDVIVKID